MNAGRVVGALIRELTGSVGLANGTIRSLAEANLDKTRALANSFDRQEVRILAKMIILRAVLDKQKSGPVDAESVIEGMGDPTV